MEAAGEPDHERHGLMNFIIHPDYIVEAQERSTYEALLGIWRSCAGKTMSGYRSLSRRIAGGESEPR